MIVERLISSLDVTRLAGRGPSRKEGSDSDFLLRTDAEHRVHLRLAVPEPETM